MNDATKPLNYHTKISLPDGWSLEFISSARSSSVKVLSAILLTELGIAGDIVVLLDVATMHDAQIRATAYIKRQRQLNNILDVLNHDG